MKLVEFAGKINTLLMEAAKAGINPEVRIIVQPTFPAECTIKDQIMSTIDSKDPAIFIFEKGELESVTPAVMEELYKD